MSSLLGSLATIAVATQGQGCQAGPGQSCVSAGGFCEIGPGANCARFAPPENQDCDSSPHTPGGGTCCLAKFDGASTPGCIAAGGTCNFFAFGCVGPISASAQDCASGGDGSGLCCFGGALLPEDAGPDAPAYLQTCASPDDCYGVATDGDVPCCTNGVCIPFEPDDCSDANAQFVQASAYDSSCTKDSDCVAIATGNACFPGALNCAVGGAINATSYAQYQADVAKTRAATCFAPTGCADTARACCVGGSCRVGTECEVPPSASRDAAGP